MNCKTMWLSSSTGGTLGRRGGRCFNSHRHSKMGSYRYEKKSWDLNSHLFHADRPLPSAFRHTGSTMHTSCFQGQYIHQHVLFYKFKVKCVAGTSGKNRDMQLLRQQGCCQAASWVSQIQWRGPGSLCLQFLSALVCSVCNLPSVISANCEFTADPLARSTSRLLLYHHPGPWNQPSKWGQLSNDTNSTKDIYAFISSQKIPVSSWATIFKLLFTVNPPLRLNNKNNNQKLQTNCFLSTVKTFRNELSAHWKNGKQPALLCAIKCFQHTRHFRILAQWAINAEAASFLSPAEEGEVEGHILKPQKLEMTVT